MQDDQGDLDSQESDQLCALCHDAQRQLKRRFCRQGEPIKKAPKAGRQKRPLEAPVGRYTHKTYNCGIAIEVDPKERAPDVLHYLITGHLLGGRSLDGVTWREIENDEHSARLSKALFRSMAQVTPNASLQPAARSADRLEGDVGQENET